MCDIKRVWYTHLKLSCTLHDSVGLQAEVNVATLPMIDVVHVIQALVQVLQVVLPVSMQILI